MLNHFPDLIKKDRRKLGHQDLCAQVSIVGSKRCCTQKEAENLDGAIETPAREAVIAESWGYRSTPHNFVLDLPDNKGGFKSTPRDQDTKDAKWELMLEAEDTASTLPHRDFLLLPTREDCALN
ncbi:UNVERIFIED_CONTAM: hypothetical protein K2H54_039035, partial [Gekko kuhli]